MGLKKVKERIMPLESIIDIKADKTSSTGSMSVFLRVYVPLLAAGAVFVLAYVRFVSSVIYPMNPDSVVFIELGYNLLNGKGFVYTPGFYAFDKDLVPCYVFPPGYPMLIAALASTGLKATDAAMWIARGSWMLLPAAVAWCLTPLNGRRTAILCGLLIFISPGVVLYGYSAMSDIPFLILIVLSLGFLFRSLTERQPGVYLITSGFLAGSGYLFRNVGIAVFASVYAAFALAAVLKVMTFREALRKLVLWSVGCVPVVAALLIWNLFSLGSIQPYSIPPEKISIAALLFNIRDFAWNMLIDLSGSKTIAQVVWSYKLIILIVLPVAALFMLGWRKYWRDNGQAERFALLVMVLYLLAGSALVVLAKSRYAVEDYVRYTVQYTWLAFAVIFVVFYGKRRIESLRSIILAAILVLPFLIGHAAFLIENLKREASVKEIFSRNENLSVAVSKLPDSRWIVTNQLVRRFSGNDDLNKAIHGLPADALIVSSASFGGFLHMETGRAIRNSEFDKLEDKSFYIRLHDAAMKTEPGRQFYFLLLPSNRMLKRYHDRWQEVFLENISSDFSVVEKTSNMLLVKFNSGRSL